MAQDPRALIQKAQKTLQSASGGFSFFSARDDKYQDAADLYIQAANAFRMQNMNKEAGNAFEEASKIQINKLKEPDDAANALVDASKVYSIDSPQDAVRCLDFAINQYCSKGSFQRAARYKAEQATLLETKLGDPKGAIESYELAAKWYKQDNSPFQANKYFEKVADIASLDGDYYKAIENYEMLADYSITTNQLPYKIKDHFFKAGICHMATMDSVATQRALNNYMEALPSFINEAECKLIVDLLAIQAGEHTGEQGSEQEQFTRRLNKYQETRKLDVWTGTMLYRVRDQISEADNEFA